jgi:hypothetical protein
MGSLGVRRLAATLFIDQRGKLEAATVVLVAAAFLLATRADSFARTLDADRRSALYGSLAGTSGALLGFVLAALAILVALPSTERVEALWDHPKWPRLPGAYLRAAWALLATLVLCTLGIAVDSATHPREPYEGVTVALLAWALVRVAAAVVALDQILAVARQRAPLTDSIDDP